MTLVMKKGKNRPVIGWPVTNEQSIGGEAETIQFFQEGAVILRNGKREIWRPEPGAGSAPDADAPKTERPESGPLPAVEAVDPANPRMEGVVVSGWQTFPR
jgi:hypothetical protein